MNKILSSLLLLGAILLQATQDCIYAQEFDSVLIIEGSPLTKAEFDILKNPEDHQVHEVVIRKCDSMMAFGEKKGYLMVYYYVMNNELNPEWVFVPTEINYDRFYYQWEPATFTWQFENSKTGDKCSDFHSLFL